MQQQQIYPGMMAQQRPPYTDYFELLRQQNLLKYQHFRQSLMAAQHQQEASVSYY